MTKSILGVAIAALILTASMAAPATAGCAEEIERAWKDKETFVNRTKELAIQKIETILGKAKSALAKGKTKKCDKLVTKAQNIIKSKY